jgi:hypothetical protein
VASARKLKPTAQATRGKKGLAARPHHPKVLRKHEKDAPNHHYSTVRLVSSTKALETRPRGEDALQRRERECVSLSAAVGGLARERQERVPGAVSSLFPLGPWCFELEIVSMRRGVPQEDAPQPVVRILAFALPPSPL